MLTPEGKVTPEEIYDMKTSMTTRPDHLMLSGESTYGAQARESIKLESEYQRETYAKMEGQTLPYYPIPVNTLKELLFIA